MSTGRPLYPELISSNVCGHSRYVRVTGPTERAAARNMRCQDCRRNESEARFRENWVMEVVDHSPISVKCPRCGLTRELKRSGPVMDGLAEARHCLSCAGYIREERTRASRLTSV